MTQYAAAYSDFLSKLNFLFRDYPINFVTYCTFKRLDLLRHMPLTFGIRKPMAERPD
jgi:hypothetical protein